MTSSLSNLVKNLAEGIHRIKCKCARDNKNCKTCKIEYKKLRMLSWIHELHQNINVYVAIRVIKKSLMKTLRNNFSIHTNFLTMICINSFYICKKVFTLMNKWMFGKNSMKLHYLKKKIFVVTWILTLNFNLDGDCVHRKRVCVDFKIKNLEEYRDLYIQTDTIFLADLFENSQNMCLKIPEFDPACFLTRFSMISSFKKYPSKVKSFTWYRYVINGRKRY